MEFDLDKYTDGMEKKGPRTMKQPEDRDDDTIKQRRRSHYGRRGQKPDGHE